MPLPAGIQTCVVHFGGATDFAGTGLTNRMQATPSRDVIWKTGPHRLGGQTYPLTAAADVDVVGSLPLPVVDQAGFKDDTGADITGWYYTLVATLTRPDGAQETVRKLFSPTSGQASVNFDDIPTDTVPTPVTVVPSVEVQSVNGRTGNVTVAPDVLLPPPSGSIDTDSANLSAAIAVIMARTVKVGAIQAQAGTYKVAGHFSFGDYYSNSAISLLGAGGGSEAAGAVTTFECHSADTQFEFPAGGGVSGHFRIDGNSVATTPFLRSGGGGASGRSFIQMTVKDNAASTTGTPTNDLAQFLGAQNDLFEQCHFINADRDLALFSEGYGGAHFIRCEWGGLVGRYGLHFDESVTSQFQVYPRPTDLTFTKGIVEGSFAAGNVRLDSCDLVSFADYVFVSGVAADKGLFQVISGFGCGVHNSYMQISKAADGSIAAGARGFWLEGLATLVLTGRVQCNDLEYAFTMNGLNCRAYMNATPTYYDVAQVNDGLVNFLGAFQIADEKSFTIRSSVGDPATPVLLYRTFAGYYGAVEYANGVRAYYPPNSYDPDSAFGRLAAGIVGATVGTLAVAHGPTANRPANPIGGTAFHDETLHRLITYDAPTATWRDGAGTPV